MKIARIKEGFIIGLGIIMIEKLLDYLELTKVVTVLAGLWRLWFVLFVAMLYLCIRFGYIIYKKCRFKIRFNYYWDNELNPYCPVHQILLRRPSHENNELYCGKCKLGMDIFDDSKKLTLAEAREKIKNR